MKNDLLTLIEKLSPEKRSMIAKLLEPAPEPIAVIGMGCRFPGNVKNPAELWEFLAKGLDGVVEVPADRWDIEAFYDPDRSAVNKMYTRSGGFLSNPFLFDSDFFGISPNEARAMDPQQRLLLEVSWEALENAGQNIANLKGSNTGVFVGIMESYYAYHRLVNEGRTCCSDPYFMIGNSCSVTSGYLSYFYDFQGPSFPVNTACSSSLVCLDLACNSIRKNECQLAIVAGVHILSIECMVNLCKTGMLSPDGRCKSFDARADGLGFSEGCGVLVLKRLKDAVKDRDNISAVIMGSAVKSDGNSNGITAPNGKAQKAVYQEALKNAGIGADDIDYVEAHGSGTSLGDPIEMESIEAVYGSKRDSQRPLLVGSIKSNMGHVASAAGVAGVMKTVLALKNRTIPPNLHLETLNPDIIENESVIIPTESVAWETKEKKRIAAVNSFGWSGTIAHAILKESDISYDSSDSRQWQLLMLSAKSRAALDKATENLARHLIDYPNLELPDVAYTLQIGRAAFDHRRFLVCDNRDDAISRLQDLDPRHVMEYSIQEDTEALTFMFPGVGDQYLNMGLELYQNESEFKKGIDECANILIPLLNQDIRTIVFSEQEETKLPHDTGFDLRKMLSAEPTGGNEATRLLNQTTIVQPIVFVFEYALAKLWISWGIVPQNMIGHSLGEYVAACIADVISLEDALKLVTKRAELIDSLPEGAMLSILLDQTGIEPLLDDQCSISIINSPSNCTVSGTLGSIERLKQKLVEREIVFKQIPTSHPLHCHLMNPIVDEFSDFLTQITYRPPKIPYISNVTGTWIKEEEATDPAYWVDHLCRTIRFSDGLDELLRTPQRVLLEVGIGQSLGSFAVQSSCFQKDQQIILGSIPNSYDSQSDGKFILGTLGQLWLRGISTDWKKYYAEEKRQKVTLPTMPFIQQRYWMEEVEFKENRFASSSFPKKSTIDDWFYLPSWKQIDLIQPNEAPFISKCWLIFLDDSGIGAEISKQLNAITDQSVITVKSGAGFVAQSNREYEIDPQDDSSYNLLTDSLNAEGLMPDNILYFWGITSKPLHSSGQAFFRETQRTDFYDLMFIARAVSRTFLGKSIQMWIVSNFVHNIESSDNIYPEKIISLGPAKVISQEYRDIKCKSIDLGTFEPSNDNNTQLLDQLIAEFNTDSSDQIIAYRDNHRWVQSFEKSPIKKHERQSFRLRKNGTYLIFGGLGDIGLDLAEYLAQSVQARLILVSRSGLPKRDSWQGWLETHEESDKTSIQIKKVQLLETLGASIVISKADIGSREQMENLAKGCSKNFGQIHGIIHCAGTVDEKEFATIHEINEEKCTSHFRAKVDGLYLLEELFMLSDLDFGLIVSSISSVLGGLGFSAYTTANLFMDAFVEKLNQTTQTPWISVDWDGAANSEETREAFHRIFSIKNTFHFIVSTTDLAARINQWLKFDESANKSSSATTLPVQNRPDLRTTFVAPEKDVEKKLAEIWTVLLGVDQIGIYDKFVDLGGNSLLATQLASQLRTVFRVEVPLRTLFNASTVADQATLIEELGMNDEEPLDCIKPGEHKDLAPLSFAQNRLWFFELLQPGNALFNLPAGARLKGRLDRDILTKCFNEIINRHEALRTSIDVNDGIPVQRISEPQDVPIRFIDLRATAQKEREDKAWQLMREEAGHPFDFAGNLLFRCLLIQLHDEEYLLLMTMHHIVSDGWSMKVLLQDLQALYHSYSKNRAPELPQSGIQYLDYVTWQQKHLEGENLENLLRYWKNQLSGFSMLELTTDFPRPKTETFEGDVQFLRIPKRLTERITALGRQNDATTYMVLLAVFNVLLYRYTGQKDIVITSPIANRNQKETEGIIGFFLNMLIMRTKLSENVSFVDLLKQVRQTTLDAYDHQDLPFEKLVEQFSSEQGTGRHPFTQVMFHVQNIPMPGMSFSGLDMEIIDVHNGGSKYDLSLDIFERPDGLVCHFEYKTNLFHADTIKRLMGHFKNLIERVLDNPTQPVSECSILSLKEMDQLLKEWNDATEYPQQCLHHLFEEQVRRNPDASAMSFADEKVSYQLLNERSNQVAHGLTQIAETSLQPIAVMLNTHPVQIETLMGILKTGRPFVCLDPDYPENRLVQILNEVDPAVLLTEKDCIFRHQSLIQDLQIESHCRVIEMDENHFQDCPVTNLNTNVSPTDTAYIVYTSGSTGRPKGIEQTHASFCQFLQWQSRQFSIQSKERIVLWASITYDASYCEVFGALCFGAELYMAPPELRYDPVKIIPWLQKEKITILQTIPSFCQQILTDLALKKVDETPFPDLKFVLLSGEALSTKLAQSWLRISAGQHKLYNLFGPSESVLASFYEVKMSDTLQRSTPIGKAIDGRQILILDQDQQLCPVGVKGEIYIRSQYLTKGYFQRPEETKKVFIQNPLHNDYDDPAYRTGDLGRWLPNGDIEFLGRVDNQIKIRGLRVELEGIEAVLSSHEAIKESAVVLQRRNEEEGQLVAYIVTNTTKPIPGLTKFLKDRLPTHMLPGSIETLECLPRHPNGKINRKALPELTSQAEKPEMEIMPPRTPLESSLAAILKDLLKLEEIGMHNDFFDLGGHSLMAVQAVNKIKELCSIDLSLGSFLENTTIADLAMRIEQDQQNRQEDLNVISQTMDELKHLSDDDVNSLLGSES